MKTAQWIGSFYDRIAGPVKKLAVVREKIKNFGVMGAQLRTPP